MAYAPYKAQNLPAAAPHGVKQKLDTGFATQPGGPATPTGMQNPMEPDTAQAQTPMFTIGGSTPQPLPPAQNTTMPVGGNNTIASGSGLGTGMASPMQAMEPDELSTKPGIGRAKPAQTYSVASSLSGILQADPTYRGILDQYAPQYEGRNGIYGAIGSFGRTLDQNVMGQQFSSQAEADAAAQQLMSGMTPDKFSAGVVQGAPDYMGQFKDSSYMDDFFGMHTNDVVRGILGVIGGGAASGLGAGAAGSGAAAGGFSSAAMGGNVQDVLRATATGAATGYLGGQAADYINGVGSGGDFQDPSMWQANDMATPNLTQLPGIDGMDVNFPEVYDKPMPELQQSGNFQDPAAWQANDQFPQDASIPKFGGVQDYPMQTVNVNGTRLSPTPAANTGSYVPPMTVPQQAQTPTFSMVGTPVAATPNTSTPSTGGNFFTQNPQLTAGLVTAGLGAVQGSGQNPPAPPSTPGGTGANPQLTAAMQQQMFGNVPGLKTTAGDPSQFYQDASDAAYRNQTRYLDPQVQQQQKALEARLSEQGFVPGTPGYNQAMQNFMDTNARAYAQARDTATLQGYQVGDTNFDNSMGNSELNNSASNSWLNQIIAMRNQPINERNAIMTGDQIQYNNQLDQYNAQQQTRNSNNQLIGQLATAIGMYFSDARLKDDITPIGQTPGGLGIYSYTIFGRREVGVIAQEVQAKQPHAVAVDPDSGFLMVDYGRIA